MNTINGSVLLYCIEGRPKIKRMTNNFFLLVTSLITGFYGDVQEISIDQAHYLSTASWSCLIFFTNNNIDSIYKFIKEKLGLV